MTNLFLQSNDSVHVEASQFVTDSRKTAFWAGKQNVHVCIFFWEKIYVFEIKYFCVLGKNAACQKSKRTSVSAAARLALRPKILGWQ